ncbi:MAG TPA: SOS response-associated peptidase [Papillibacter sp.]|jgi:putative SOS response-associated peptidase YedK|nr:SOS response-associated peptidase [Papillibacter sp.]
MCGRYYVDDEEPTLQDIVEKLKGNAEVKTGEVFPTDRAAVMAPEGDFAVMRWGFPRFDGKGVIINARSETASVKPMFQRSLIEGRCLIPASWYFEWEKRGREKVKYAFAAPEEELLWMAGLSRRDGKTGERSFVILTRPAWEGIAFIHNRMPVILPAHLHDEWICGRDPVKTMERATSQVRYRTAD